MKGSRRSQCNTKSDRPGWAARGAAAVRWGSLSTAALTYNVLTTKLSNKYSFYYSGIKLKELLRKDAERCERTAQHVMAVRKSLLDFYTTGRLHGTLAL